MTATPLTLIVTAVFAPALAGLLTMLLPREQTTPRSLLAVGGMLLSTGCLLLFVRDAGVGALDPGALAVPFVPSLDLALTFNPDRLGMFFALLVAGVGVLIALYARAYFGPDPDALFRFFPTLGLFASAMLGLVLADNMLAMLLFWEMTSLSSFLLIGWERADRKAVRLALQALAVTGLGGLGLLGGVILLAQAAGTWSFAEALSLVAAGPDAMPAPTLLPWAFGLMILGGATKSAQWPFHFWLPGAMAAPTPVSAYLHSATMVKAGVYLFGRLAPAFAGVEFWTVTLIPVGAVTMTFGAWLALRSVELKKIFAYTTVSQLGLFTCMYGLAGFTHAGGPNLVWPVTQILNHALYKAPLFLMAGAIAHTAGVTTLPRLRGFARTSPLLAWITLAAGYALAAGPFTLSFAAKEAFLEQVAHAIEHQPRLWIVAGMAVLTAACNVAIFLRFLTTFLARPDAETDRAPDHHHADGWRVWLWAPAALLVAWQFLGGVAPALLETPIAFVETHALAWAHLPTAIDALAHPGVPLALSAAAIALGVVFALIPRWRRPITDPHDRLFPESASFLGRVGWGVFSTLQTGNLRHYLYFMLTAFLLGMVAATLKDPAFLAWPALASLWSAPLGFIVASLSLFAIVTISSVALPIFNSRIVRVMMLGAVGMSVTGVYLLHQAPDLALTQLMFEIISVILFLLVLRMIPEEPPLAPVTGLIGRIAFSLAVGGAIGWVVLQAGAHVDATGGPGDLGRWFLANASEGGPMTHGRGGGGDNAVNVILVDFRGYDTLGETTVLAIAAMGIFALIAAVPRRERDRAYVVDPARLSSSLFRTAMKLILPLGLLFAAYMFFKGHNEPGGGFIAGLVASVVLAVYRMAKGPEALKSLLPIKPGVLAASGLLMVLATALTPLAFGLPVLTSYNGLIPLPGSDPYHFSTVVFFDLGVLIVVIAVSAGVIHRLTEELET